MNAIRKQLDAIQKLAQEEWPAEPADWDGHPDQPVTDDEVQRLIAEDWERTAGR